MLSVRQLNFSYICENMLSEDYLIRMIRQAAAVMAKIIGLKNAGQFLEALQVIDQGLEQTLGMNIDLVNLLDDESLYRVLTTNELLDLERLGIIADLFKEEGDILNLQKQKPESDSCYIRSLNYYLIMSNDKNPLHPNELSHKIEELIQKLANFNLPDKTLFDLFCYYENEGEYAKADDILARLATRSNVNADVRNERISFYKRLLKKSPKELSAGGMKIKQIQDKLKGL
jgi:tetratricopeptide (TPR) repeat protein